MVESHSQIDQHAMLRTVFEAAPNAMILVDQGGRINLVNEQAERLFGYPRAELLGSNVDRLVPQRYRANHPEQRASWFARPAARAMGGGRDLFGLRKDGSEVPIEIGLNPMRTSTGTFVLAAIIDITERKRGEVMLRASLAEKEILLREIHHRVKNNMQVICSMLSLQSHYVDEGRHRAMFEQCEGRVRAMALIHEKLYGATNLTTIDFGQYARELTTMLVAAQPAAEAFRVRFELSPIVVDIQAAIPLGLILNELVTNAIKHAFTTRLGTIGILLQEVAATRCALEVRDDGHGLPPDFESTRTRGLGMRIIGGLVRQLDGTFQCTGRAGAGAVFRVEFPLSRGSGG
ncbi:MAG: PAS domain S-box protein [Planctomycetes bacterium]|nr:PAS domain S-box protein [Planctomycetota bacterium]